MVHRRVFLTVIVCFAAIVLVSCGSRYQFPVPDNREPGWDSGLVAHILPTVNHDTILMKVSFVEPLPTPPFLVIDGKSVEGVKTDTEGYFWSFLADHLKPNTAYSLSLLGDGGKALCQTWTLTTFPLPGDSPDHLRLLAYTGLGGHDVNITWRKTGPLPIEVRRRLLKRALSFEPDVIIASGDHIYYDLVGGRSAKYMAKDSRAIKYVGTFDPSTPVLGTKNEEILLRAVNPQIRDVYGTLCRSLPVFFIIDDHDYFENDEAIEKRQSNIKDLFLGWRSPFVYPVVTFPPDAFHLELARAVQHLYYPEFLPDPTRSVDLPGTGAPDRAPGISENFGTLRYGRLAEVLMYDCRRYISLTGKDAVFIPTEAEEWLIERMSGDDTTHLIHASPIIYGWSAGKWLEWYPDVLDDEGKLTTKIPKYLWQEGWFSQHNRILKAASEMKRRIPLFVCGDIHNQSEGKILKSGNVDLSMNPIISVASGSLGTGPRGFPSAFRGTPALPPNDLIVEEGLKSVERNGFIILDITPKKITIRFFAWKPPDPVEAIDTLEPYHTLELDVSE